MGKFSKNNNNISDFFEKMKSDVEKEREEKNNRLDDFDDESDLFKTGAIKIDFDDKKEVSDPLKMIQSKVMKVDFSDEEEKSEPVHEEHNVSTEEPESLLEKCRVFTQDEDGNDYVPQDTHLYELKSVAEILKNESQDAIESLSKKYHIEITDTVKNGSSEQSDDLTDVFEVDENKKTEEEITDKRTKEFIDMVNDSGIKSDVDEVNISTENSAELPEISDIDSSQKFDANNTVIKEKHTTIKFIPVKDDNQKKPKISLSSFTGNIGAISKETDDTPQNNIETKLESNDFDDYIPEKEIENFEDLKKNIIKYSKKKRFKFLQIFSSLLCFIGLLVFLIPSVFEKFTTDFATSSVVLISILSLDLLFNIDMFAGFKNLFSKFAKPDVSLALASVSAISILLIHYFSSFTDYIYESYYLALTVSFAMLVRAVLIFCYYSSKLIALKITYGKNPKNAVTLINDQTVTFAMAKNSIEGDALISAPRKVDFIKDFNKYFDYNMILNGKFYYYQIIGTILAIVLAIAGSVYFENIILGLSCFTIISLIISLPTAFMINILPIYSANKKLRLHGAMISGVAGAMQIENSNAALVYSSELFPSGSVVLKDMKILSDNSIDDTILKAASLTEAVNSTLAPIFKKIAKTNSAYILPDSDTVKYEERLGLSGWVDNELLFIGNRTLLESHGISVPDIEVDRQILKNGYFPVYLATVQKACALLVVKYIPDYSISKVLRKISTLGVTLLINNNDPNINEEMIADYFDIYDDTLKVLSNSGVSMYNKAASFTESAPSPAVYKRNNLSLVKIINSANSVKKSNYLLTILYVIISILFATGFVYLTFSQKDSFPTTSNVLLFEVISTVFSLIVYLFKKP